VTIIVKVLSPEIDQAVTALVPVLSLRTFVTDSGLVALGVLA
jgi:hypothetical protein